MIKIRKNLFLSALGLTMYSLLGPLSLALAMEEAESKTSNVKARIPISTMGNVRAQILTHSQN